MDDDKLSPRARILVRDLRRMIGVLTLGAFLVGLWAGWAVFRCP